MKKLKRLALLVIIGLLVSCSGLAFAGISGSKHDLSLVTEESQVCIFCHTPHGATTQGPLWNREASAVAYIPYSSGSLNANIEELASGQGLADGSSGDLCLSCHDGTVAVNSLMNSSTNAGNPAMQPDLPQFLEGKIIGAANLGSNLSNDHPINFIYDAALASADGGLVTPYSERRVKETVDLPLFNGKMQCSTCHDVHEPGGTADKEPFLRVSMYQSGLCLECHLK